MAQTNLSTEKKLMDLENRLVVARGRGRKKYGLESKVMQTIAFGVDKQ